MGSTSWGFLLLLDFLDRFPRVEAEISVCFNMELGEHGLRLSNTVNVTEYPFYIRWSTKIRWFFCFPSFFTWPLLFFSHSYVGMACSVILNSIQVSVTLAMPLTEPSVKVNWQENVPGETPWNFLMKYFVKDW